MITLHKQQLTLLLGNLDMLTANQMADLARDIADLRKYGFKFSEAVSRVLDRRTDVTTTTRTMIIDFAEAAWNRA